MQQQDSFELMHRFVQGIHPLATEEWETFAAGFVPFEARRKQVLTAAGHIERHLYFVLSGVQRSYFLSPADKEATIVFTYAGSFSGVADSFLTQQPSRFYFETLTASSFLRTTYSHVAATMDRYPNFERFVRIITARTLAGVLQRQVEVQCYSAEEKFKSLLQRSPHVLRLIPHKYLANYLGIDATTFSKLLGTVRL
jgi:CRP-like cAMP-binding protein